MRRVADEIGRADQTREAARILAEASNLLASSLDYEATLAGVAQLAVRSLADFCIVDIVEDALDIEVGSGTPGVLGSAVIKGRATEVIDVGHFLPLADADWFRRRDMAREALTRSLLLVDDSAFFRNMLSPVLKAAGYDVTAVASPDEALALIKTGRRFSVVVSDIEMPGMNGPELQRALRKEPGYDGVPVVFLTSLISAEEAGNRELISNGCRYLSKSAPIEVIHHCIERAMAEGSQRVLSN